MSDLFTKLHEAAEVPEETSYGFDVIADDKYIIQPFGRQVVTTGITVTIPTGYYGRISARTGLAIKHGLTILDSLVEPEYTGELKVVLFNTDRRPFYVNPGYKIAHLTLEPIVKQYKHYKVTGV